MTMPVTGGGVAGTPITGCGGSTTPTMGLGGMIPSTGFGLITTPMTGFGLMMTPVIGLAKTPVGANAAAKAVAVASARSEVRVDIWEPLLDEGGSTHPLLGRRIVASGSANVAVKLAAKTLRWMNKSTGSTGSHSG